MHPEIMRELTAQHGRDLRERAHHAVLVRSLRRGARRAEADEFVVPDIPDYVDGSFRTAEDDAASHVPAARHAA